MSWSRCMFLLVAVGLTSACEGDTRTHTTTDMEAGGYRNLSYEFTGPDCSTGKHEFRTQEEYCEGLRSRARNRGCELDARRSAWEERCRPAFSESD